MNKRLNIELSEKLKSRLAEASERSGLTMSEIARSGIVEELSGLETVVGRD